MNPKILKLAMVIVVIIAALAAFICLGQAANKYPKLHTMPPEISDQLIAMGWKHLGHFVDQDGVVVVFAEKDGECKTFYFVPGALQVFASPCEYGMKMFKEVCFVDKFCGVDVYAPDEAEEGEK